jgi:arylsulfatase A-like enzyme
MPKTDKPNILVLWGDDIGWWNISYNNRGQMSSAVLRCCCGFNRDICASVTPVC